MRQRWVRHGETNDDDSVRTQLVKDFPHMLKRDNVCAELAKAIRKNGSCFLALAAEEKETSASTETAKNGTDPDASGNHTERENADNHRYSRFSHQMSPGKAIEANHFGSFGWN